MSNLQTVGICPTLNQTEQTIVWASKQVKALNVKDFDTHVNQIITDVAFDLGTRMEANDIKLQTRKLKEEIAVYFPGITIPELRTAFKNGLRKIYGDFFGLNISTYHQWIKSYLNEEKRGALILKQQQYELELANMGNTRPPEEKIDAIMFNAFNDALEIYTNCQWYNDLGNSVHEFLVRKGKIKSDSYLRYMDEAERKVKVVSNSLTKDEYRAAKAFIEKLNAGEAVPKVEFVAKEICLNEYLKYMTK